MNSCSSVSSWQMVRVRALQTEQTRPWYDSNVFFNPLINPDSFPVCPPLTLRPCYTQPSQSWLFRNKHLCSHGNNVVMMSCQLSDTCSWLKCKSSNAVGVSGYGFAWTLSLRPREANWDRDKYSMEALSWMLRGRVSNRNPKAGCSSAQCFMIL